MFFTSESSSSKFCNLFLLISSVSLTRPAFSISNCKTFLLRSSISCGIESISVLTIEDASSIKSIALSGKNLSVIYLSLRVTHAITAESVIFIPWWISYFSFIPLRIEIVSSTVGSFTNTFWNLLSKAPSFSIYFLYSSSVVAPIVCNSPLARIGFNIFDASKAPSVFPAPTKVWISSMNKIISPSEFLISSRTAFNLSSNSPLNLAPAIKLPISNEKIILFFNPSGTSLFTILWANPSTIAVLPTPGSPIKTGLFFVLLDKILIECLISSSLPITGSSLPFLASSVKFLPYFNNSSLVLPSLCSFFIFLIPIKAYLKELYVMLYFLKISDDFIFFSFKRER